MDNDYLYFKKQLGDHFEYYRVPKDKDRLKVESYDYITCSGWFNAYSIYEEVLTYTPVSSEEVEINLMLGCLKK